VSAESTGNTDVVVEGVVAANEVPIRAVGIHACAGMCEPASTARKNGELLNSKYLCTLLGQVMTGGGSDRTNPDDDDVKLTAIRI
tara:strand:+ start:299 stop:553 length:255 start_codon:yes stop_codon:yes gene_type:complete